MPAATLPAPTPVPSRPVVQPSWPDRRRGWAVAALPALVLLLLGAVQLHRHLGLWYDEDYTVLAVKAPLPTLLSAVWHSSPLVSWLTVAPSFNAPYYVLMHGWAAVFGTSVLSLRLPSLICSALAVAVLARVVRRLGGDRAGLVAGLLAATGPLWAQQSVEARSYGLAELATALMALALVRRHQGDARRWPLVLATASAGLLHWFTLPVVAGLAVATLVVRRRAGLGDAVAMGLASLPAVGLVALQVTGSGDGTPIAAQLGLDLPVQGLSDWSQGAWWLSVALVAAFVVALLRGRHRALLTGWVVVPLLLITTLDLVKPLYFGRYLLFTLMGLAAGAALGLEALRGRLRTAATVGLVGLSVAACLPRLQSEAREHQDRAVALLEAEQVAGQPVAAGDGRAALELEEQISLEHSRLAADLLLRPEHVPTGGTATVAWVVRSGSGSATQASPNDAWLAAGGWTLQTTTVVHGTYGDLTLQRWVR